jgi:hypothetical protein
MSSKKSYEVLQGLPPYGPMYIPIGPGFESPYSEGYVVRFIKADGSTWIANFGVGWTSFTFIEQFSQSRNVVVIAKGQGYIISAESKDPIAVFGVDINWADLYKDKNLVFTTGTVVGIINETGQLWYSERISWDEMKNIVLEENKISGLSLDPTQTADVWIPFELDLETKELRGGSFNRA